jgi:hypothetical protein
LRQLKDDYQVALHTIDALDLEQEWVMHSTDSLQSLRLQTKPVCLSVDVEVAGDKLDGVPGAIGAFRLPHLPSASSPQAPE